MLAGLHAARRASRCSCITCESLARPPVADAMLAAITTTIAWGPLMRKRISRLTAETLPWWMRLFGVMIGASVPAEQHQPGSFCGISRDERDSAAAGRSARSLFVALIGLKPTEAGGLRVQMLVGLLMSNGPGTISAQGAKGAVAADGPRGPRARADQQGDDRLPDPHRLQPMAATASRAWRS